MSNKATAGIIAVTIIAALFGLYAAFAKTTTTIEKDPTQHEVGGIGDSILSEACNLLGIKC